MCDPVVMLFSRRGCFIIPNLSLWMAVLLCSPTALSHSLFPVLHWEHKEAGDRGRIMVCFSPGCLFLKD